MLKRGNSDNYDPARDLTLTHGQAKNEGFRPGTLGDFRSPSNQTLAGHKSGYHEAVVTTDTYNFLKGAQPSGNNTHQLPHAPPGSYFHPYSGMKVPSSNLGMVVGLADGYRTDTALTILSAPGGKAAGHTGSGVSQQGQGPAHDLLRGAVMNVLQTNPRTPGFNEKSVASLFASITVTSIAPGEIARGRTGGTATLKDKDAKATYEERRNMAKAHINAIYQQLNKAEQNFVSTSMQQFIDSTQVGVIFGRRQLGPNRSTSPERVARLGIRNQVEGGGYKQRQAKQPKLRVRVKIRHIGLFTSSSFRSQRRTGNSTLSPASKRRRIAGSSSV